MSEYTAEWIIYVCSAIALIASYGKIVYALGYKAALEEVRNFSGKRTEK